MSAVRIFQTNVGDGVATSFLVHHKLGTLVLDVAVIDRTTGRQLPPNFDRPNRDTVQVHVGYAPEPLALSVVVSTRSTS